MTKKKCATERRPTERVTATTVHTATREHSPGTQKTQNTLRQIDACMLTFHITPAIKPQENTDTMVFGTDCASGHQTCQTHPRTPHSASFTQEHIATTSNERNQSNVCCHGNGTSQITAGRGIGPTQNQTSISDMCPRW